MTRPQRGRVIREGAAASFILNDRGERMVQPSDEVKSALDIFVKDMRLVLDAGRAPPVSHHPSHPPPNSYSSPDTVQGSAVATTPQ